MADLNRTSQANCIVFKEDNDGYKFLVLKRREDRGGFWQAITGGVRPGEEISAGAKRELREETGIENFKRFIDLDYSFTFDFPHIGEITENCFAAEVSPETEIVMSDEHTEYKWLALDEAIGLLKYESNKEAFRRLGKLKEIN